MPDEEWARTAALAREEVATLLSRPGSRVVVDDTLCFRFLRADFAQVAAEGGRESVLLVLGTPMDEIRRRIAENVRRPARPGVTGAVLERHLATFEWPSADEPHRVMRDVSELEAWLVAESVRW